MSNDVIVVTEPDFVEVDVTVTDIEVINTIVEQTVVIDVPTPIEVIQVMPELGALELNVPVRDDIEIIEIIQQGAQGPPGPPVADGDKGDITVSGGGSTWTIDPLAVTDAKIADLTITGTKIADLALTSRHYTAGSIGTLPLADDSVTNIKLSKMSAFTFKGNNTAALADPRDMTAAQATAMLSTFTSSEKGLVPSSTGTQTEYLRADGTWAVPPGIGGSEYTDEQAQDAVGLITDSTLVYDDAVPSLIRAALTGDVTAAAGSNALAIAAGVVTNAKLATMPATTVKANITAGVATPTDVTTASLTNSLYLFTAANRGMVPPPVTATGKFLKDDGTWAVPVDTSYTDEQAQDAIGLMVDASLVYDDATPRLQRAALTGDVTATAGSNALAIAANAVTTVKIADLNVTTAKIADYNVTDVKINSVSLRSLSTRWSPRDATTKPDQMYWHEATNYGSNYVRMEPPSLDANTTLTLPSMTGTLMVREELDPRFVNATGDIMTGPLQVGAIDQQHVLIDDNTITARKQSAYLYPPAGGTQSAAWTADAPEFTITGNFRLTMKVRNENVDNLATTRVIAQHLSGSTQLAWRTSSYGATIYPIMGYPTGTATPQLAHGTARTTFIGGMTPTQDIVYGLDVTGVNPAGGGNCTCQTIQSLDEGATWIKIGAANATLPSEAFCFASTSLLYMGAMYQGRIYWVRMEELDAAGVPTGNIIWEFDANDSYRDIRFQSTLNVDSNADGIADGWGGYAGGGGTGTRSMVNGTQQFTTAFTAVGQYYGVSTPTGAAATIPCTPGESVGGWATVSGSAPATAGLAVTVWVYFQNAAGTYLAPGPSVNVTMPLTSTPTLLYTPSLAAPANAAFMVLVVRAGATSGTPDGSAAWTATVNVHDGGCGRLDWTDRHGRTWTPYSAGTAVVPADETLELQPNGSPTTFGGKVTLAADPVDVLEAATKQYVDAKPTGIDQATADARYVNTTGDTMTGALTLAADPASALEPATKQYVDALPVGMDQATADARYVNIDGDTMTGSLTVNLDVVANASGRKILGRQIRANSGAGGGAYGVGMLFGYNGAETYCHSIETQHSSTDNTKNGFRFRAFQLGDAHTTPSKNLLELLSTGLIAGAPVILPADPTAAMQAVTKQYVDPTAWANVTFLNSWVNFGGAWATVQYRKIGDVVYIRGVAASGTATANTVLFNLPTGFRPLGELRFVNYASTAIGAFGVRTNGDVIITAGSNAHFPLNCAFSTV